MLPLLTLFPLLFLCSLPLLTAVTRFRCSRLLAQISFLSLRQVFPAFSTCLEASFSSQASISWLFHLPGSHFPSQASISWLFHLPGSFLFLLRQVFPNSSACLEASFSPQASISCLFHLPGSFFFLSGKYFLALSLARKPFFLLRQVFPSFSTCPEASFFSSGSRGCLGNSVPFIKLRSRQLIMAEIRCLNGDSHK